MIILISMIFLLHSTLYVLIYSLILHFYFKFLIGDILHITNADIIFVTIINKTVI